MGGRRQRNLPPLRVRVVHSMAFLLGCFGATAVIGLIVYNVDKADLPTQGSSAMLWQTFEATLGPAVVAAIGMWLVHLATTLLVNRIRRMRASDGVSSSALAGVLAYPFYMACTWLVDSMGPGTSSRGWLLHGSMLMVPSVVATLIAPLLIRQTSGRG